MAMSLLHGINLSTYADECVDAAHDLDRRRQEHETRHRRFRLELRPAPRSEMENFVSAVGVTDLVHHENFNHAPVKVVGGGVMFAPERMTVSTLTDVYLACKGIRRAPDKIYDRVVEILHAYPSGLRLKDVMALADTPRTSTQRALEQLEGESKVRVRLEKTRGSAGSRRKRYYPIADQPVLRLDSQTSAGNPVASVIADPTSPDPALL